MTNTPSSAATNAMTTPPIPAPWRSFIVVVTKTPSGRPMRRGVARVSAIVTALNFNAASWLPLIASLMLLGLIYAAIGALAGALLDKLAATYLMLFLVMTDLGVVQTPMFHVTPGRLAVLLPGYGPSRVMYDGAFSSTFHAGSELLLSLGWAAALAIAVAVVLRRAVGDRG